MSAPTSSEPVARRLRILVSSVVYGYEDFLESIYRELEQKFLLRISNPASIRAKGTKK